MNMLRILRTIAVVLAVLTGLCAVTAHADTSRLGEMVTIPAGKFLMGNNGKEGFDNPDELPQHWVEMPAYQIGKYEVTRGQYRKFIEAGGYKDPDTGRLKAGNGNRATPSTTRE